jgi:hypothetical protein
MNLKERLQLAWRNKGQIAEGFYNAYVSQNKELQKEALRRLEVCRTNQCGLYNPKGENTDTLKAAFPGAESCGGCGCKLYEACHTMSKTCSLADIGKEPLWEAVMTTEQQDEIAYIQQQKRKAYEEHQRNKKQQ